MLRIGLAASGALENVVEFQRWVESTFAAYGAGNECYTDMVGDAGMRFAEAALVTDNHVVCVYPVAAEHTDEIKAIEEKAIACIYINQTLAADSTTVRDKYIVDSCDVLLVVPDGRSYGKVYNMMTRAQGKGKTIVTYEG